MKGIIILMLMSASILLLSGVYLHHEVKELRIVHQQYKEDEQQLGDAYNMLNEVYAECEGYLQSIDTIHRYSVEYNVDPKVVLAVMKVESNFNSDAENGDYKGLMQVDENYFGSKMEALDFEKNTECGVSLLSGLSKDSTDLNYILNSYNMGKTGYQNYVKRTGEISRSYSRKAIEIINKLKQ